MSSFGRCHLPNVTADEVAVGDDTTDEPTVAMTARFLGMMVPSVRKSDADVLYQILL